MNKIACDNYKRTKAVKKDDKLIAKKMRFADNLLEFQARQINQKDIISEEVKDLMMLGDVYDDSEYITGLKDKALARKALKMKKVD